MRHHARRELWPVLNYNHINLKFNKEVMNQTPQTGTIVPDHFLDQALARAGSDKLSAEHKEILKGELLIQVEERVRLRSLESLNDESLQEFGEFISTQLVSAEAVVGFFEQRIPNYTQFIADTVNQTVEEFVSLAQS